MKITNFYKFIIIKITSFNKFIVMKYITNLSKIRSLDQKLSPFKKAAKIPKPSNGWLKVIRKTLGMTSTQLAKKTGLSQPRISQIEQHEATGQLRIATLQKLASAMDLELVYGFAPTTSLEDQLKKQATKIAKKRLERMQHSMKLEQQGISEAEKRELLENVVQELIEELPKNFWNR